MTVPLPVFFIFIMVMNGLTLENADAGIRMYLKGIEVDGTEPDFGALLGRPAMWADACGQIFFSLGICMGTMTSYSSFNPVNKPIIGDGFKIAFTNALISFIAGFACFSIVGYLVGQDSPVSDKVSSIGLAFVAYPAAIETMPSPNLWAVILGITLFTLGIDSSFSMLEATATVMADAYAFRDMPRKLLALLLCVLGAISSIFFSFNWGFTYFDVVDHYLNVYLMLLIGVLETMGVGWVYEATEICAESAAVRKAVITFSCAYWGALAVIGPCNFFVFPLIFGSTHAAWIGPLLFILVVVIGAFISKSISGYDGKKWWKTIGMGGVRKLSRTLTRLSKEEGVDEEYWWEDWFEFYWGFCIKYWCPFAIFWLLMYSFKADTEKPYGGYHWFWQLMGFVYPIGGFISFAIPLCVCTEKDPLNDLVDEAFDENNRVGTGCQDVFELMNKIGKDKDGNRASEKDVKALSESQIERKVGDSAAAKSEVAINEEVQS